MALENGVVTPKNGVVTPFFPQHKWYFVLVGILLVFRWRINPSSWNRITWKSPTSEGVLSHTANSCKCVLVTAAGTMVVVILVMTTGAIWRHLWYEFLSGYDLTLAVASVVEDYVTYCDKCWLEQVWLGTSLVFILGNPVTVISDGQGIATDCWNPYSEWYTPDQTQCLEVVTLREDIVYSTAENLYTKRENRILYCKCWL